MCAVGIAYSSDEKSSTYPPLIEAGHALMNAKIHRLEARIGRLENSCCPNCGQADVSGATEEESPAVQAPQTTQNVITQIPANPDLTL
jgi:hypothetical protein